MFGTLFLIGMYNKNIGSQKLVQYFPKIAFHRCLVENKHNPAKELKIFDLHSIK